jgi:hypothetical protein
MIIHAQSIDSFNRDKWRVLIVTEPGTIPVIQKDGSTVDVAYRAGDAILGDETDSVIAGPVNLAGAIDLAERVLDCNLRVGTDPRTLLCLATALVAFTNDSDNPNSPRTPALTPTPPSGRAPSPFSPRGFPRCQDGQSTRCCCDRSGQRIC